MNLRELTAASLALAIGGAPVAAQELEELDFGIISTESAQGLQESFDPFIEDLEAYLGIPVNPFFAPDYGGVIEAMRFDQVDIAWFGNKSAMEAVDRAGGEIFAQTVKTDGTAGYYALLITHVDSPLESVEDILVCDKSLTFGNGDPNSTSGFLVPGYYVFAQNGFDPKACYATVVNANHETNVLAVANKQVDFATNNTETLYARLGASRPEAADQVKEIWRSPLIPSDPMVWRADLPAEMKQKILYFFMTYGRFGEPEEIERQRQVLADLHDGWGPFLMSSNLQLIPIRQLELFRDKTSIESDPGLSEEEKKVRIAEIDARLAELAELAAIVAPATE